MRDEARVFTSWLELVLTVAVVILLAAAGLLTWDHWLLRDDIRAVNRSVATSAQNNLAAIQQNREVGYQNRAQLCRLTGGLGFSLEPGSPCLDPNVTRYYEPNQILTSRAQATSARALEVSCAVAVRLNVHVPECGP